MYIQDLTFVPNPSYTGEKAYIAFTAQGTDSAGATRTFKGKIEVTLTQEKTDLTVSTKRDTPLKLSSTLFEGDRGQLPARLVPAEVLEVVCTWAIRTSGTTPPRFPPMSSTSRSSWTT